MTTWEPPQCSTGKVGYRSQGRALKALRLIVVGDAQAAVHLSTLPRSVYRCERCGAWHLTKREAVPA
jgi:hypothetical protein